MVSFFDVDIFWDGSVTATLDPRVREDDARMRDEGRVQDDARMRDEGRVRDDEKLRMT